ncbi:hypothetical protein FQZ97_822540 [compost metagenome]
MRVAGEDEALDAEVGVFLDARRHLLRIAHQGGAGAAAYQAHAGPEVGGDFQVVATSTVQRGHAPLAFGVEAGEGLLGGGDGLIRDVLDQLAGRAPGLVGGFPDDHVQADAELDGAAMARGAFAYVGDLLCHGLRWLAPGQVDVHLFAGQVMGSIGGAAEVERRVGLLDGRVEGLGVLHLQVLAGEVHGFPLQDAAPDAQEFVGDFIALGVAEMDAIAAILVRVAAGDHVDQQAAAGEAVEGRGHARGNRGRDDPRADRHQVAQALGQRRQGRGHHPGVLAGAPGGDQHAVVAEAVGGLRYLLEVGQGDRSGALAGAEEMAVTVGGEKPENVHVGSFRRSSAGRRRCRRTTGRRARRRGRCGFSGRRWQSGSCRNRPPRRRRRWAGSAPGRS